MIRTNTIATAILTATFVFVAGMAQAQNAVNIGGKKSITAIASITTSDPDEGDNSDLLQLGALGAYTTQDARFEVGGGLSISGIFSDDFEFVFYNLTGEARVNSNAFGVEENMLVYLGGIAGLSIIRGDAGSADFDDEVGIFGPKIGFEAYVSPRLAIQIQEALLVDTEKNLTNQITLGLKLLFN